MLSANFKPKKTAVATRGFLCDSTAVLFTYSLSSFSVLIGFLFGAFIYYHRPYDSKRIRSFFRN